MSPYAVTRALVGYIASIDNLAERSSVARIDGKLTLSPIQDDAKATRWQGVLHDPLGDLGTP